jgi:hypothetical protein
MSVRTPDVLHMEVMGGSGCQNRVARRPRAVTMSEPSAQTHKSSAQRWPHLLSTVLFIAAIAFAGAAVYLYFNESDTPSGPERPAAEAGRNEFAHIVGGLTDAGLSAQPGRYSAEANQLTQPGQTIEVEDHNLFVFIYPDADGATAVADREADAADLDPETLELTSRSAQRPLNEGEELHIFQGSNVVAILVGGDDDLATTIEDVIASLP